MSVASESTVCLDSGWVSDGHFICWNGAQGAMLSHAEHCPYKMHNGFKMYLCSPSIQTANHGVTLDDLPPEQGKACLAAGDIGAEPIRWRLIEYIHPDIPVAEQNNLASFMIEISHGE